MGSFFLSQIVLDIIQQTEHGAFLSLILVWGEGTCNFYCFIPPFFYSPRVFFFIPSWSSQYVNLDQLISIPFATKYFVFGSVFAV